MGTRNRVIGVERAKPPITARASGFCISLPAPKPSASGKSDMLASSRGTVKVAHPEIPGLWYAVNCGYESEQYATLKQQLREARQAIKSLKRPAAVAVAPGITQ